MRLSFVDMATVSDAGAECHKGNGAKCAPDDGFAGALRDISGDRGQAGRHSEVHQDGVAPLTDDGEASVSHGSVPIDRSSDGAAESEEGKMDFSEAGGDEESFSAYPANVQAIHWQAAVPLLNAIAKAHDEDAATPVGASCMPLEGHDVMPLALTLSPEGGGKGEWAAQGMAPSSEGSMEIPEAAAYAYMEETIAFDARSFKDAVAKEPDKPIRPETSMSTDTLSNPAYQTGDVLVSSEAHGHETTADGLGRKAGDPPMKVEGQNNGTLPYISLSSMDSADGFGHNPEGGDKGRDRDGAVGDFVGASGSGAPAFSLLNETGDYGKDPAIDVNRAAGTEGAEGIYQRIEDAVSSIQSKAVRSIRLRLHPENMGEMSLRLIESDSVVSARITVSSPVVKDLLDADSSRLRGIFLAEGISLGKCSVELSSNLSSNDSRGFTWAWGNNGHGNGASAMRAMPALGRGLENGLTGAYNSFPAGRGGIDVFV